MPKNKRTVRTALILFLAGLVIQVLFDPLKVGEILSRRWHPSPLGRGARGEGRAVEGRRGDLVFTHNLRLVRHFGLDTLKEHGLLDQRWLAVTYNKRDI